MNMSVMKRIQEVFFVTIRAFAASRNGRWLTGILVMLILILGTGVYCCQYEASLQVTKA